VIEIPPKRHLRTTISYLAHDEITALLRAPDRTTWLGRRDHALLLVAIQTGVAGTGRVRVGYPGWRMRF
jgi:integrase/recombinase XerD